MPSISQQKNAKVSTEVKEGNLIFQEILPNDQKTHSDLSQVFLELGLVVLDILPGRERQLGVHSVLDVGALETNGAVRIRRYGNSVGGGGCFLPSMLALNGVSHVLAYRFQMQLTRRSKEGRGGHKPLRMSTRFELEAGFSSSKVYSPLPINYPSMSSTELSQVISSRIDIQTRLVGLVEPFVLWLSSI
jgi:hypothetical protein